MNIKNLHKLFLQSNGVTTDSRAIKGGEIFIALKGENFDGNAYALKALESGAAYAVVDADSEAAKSSDKRIIIAENTLIALQALAREHRSAARVAGKPLQVIGLTGTNGKTTTKELIRSVLSTKYTLTATEGNLNNSIRKCKIYIFNRYTKTQKFFTVFTVEISINRRKGRIPFVDKYPHQSFA
jgi:UDP-N-acetylmuramoyl-tripeptide--D-alanyl-D-alanine ligase